MINVDFAAYNRELPYVTSKEIYSSVSKDDQKFHPEGLYSEVIFGPKLIYCCQCKELKGRCFDGETCEFCSVKCNDGTQRKKQFAKIKLPRKIMLPIFKNALQSIYGIKAISDILARNKYSTNITNPFVFDVQKLKLVRISQVKKDSTDPYILQPVYDIYSLNKLFDQINTDSYLRHINERFINPEHFHVVFTDEIIVTPPATRPITTLHGKQSIHELSKFYKTLLSLKSSTIWANPNEQDKEFHLGIYKFQSAVDKLYEYLFEKNFTDKYSLMRESWSGSTVEFSQRSTIIPNPALHPAGIGLSAESTKKLFMPEYLHWKYTKCTDEVLENGCTDRQELIEYVQLVQSGNSNFDIDKDEFIEFLQDKGHELKSMIERPPVLWRYNFSAVHLEKVLFDTDGYELFDSSNYQGPRLSNTTKYQNKIMEVNTAIAAMFNLDFDGDNLSTYALHSNQAKQHWHDAYIGNNIRFEHNNSIIPCPEHEAIYSMWALTEACERKYEGKEVLTFNTFDDFVVDWNLLNETPNIPVMVMNYPDHPLGKSQPDPMLLPYALMCINKSVGYMLIDSNPGAMPKKKTKKLLEELLKNHGEKGFYEVFAEFNKFLLLASTFFAPGNPTFDLGDFAINSPEIMDYKDTLINEPYIGFHQNDILFSEKVKPLIAKNPENSLHRVSESDARIKSVQLLKAASNNGIPTDIHGKAFLKNVKEDLLTGQTKEGFFMSGDSARLALAQRQEAIPKGGELQRKFYWATGFLRTAGVEDCKSTRGLPIKVVSASHLSTLEGRYYLDTEKKLHKVDINDKSLIGKTLVMRNPGDCKQPGYKICNKCLGDIRPKSENLGAAIGAYISESIIQSVLRTHHFSGAFITEIRKDVLAFIKNNRFESPNFVYTKNIDEIQKLENLYKDYYPMDGDITINYIGEIGSEFKYEICVHETPFNDDSVKKLKNIINVIDVDRKDDDLLTREEMYSELLREIILPNGILSIYVELIMSILYYDEFGTILRYSKTGVPAKQIAIKNVIKTCDPRLSIYYTFNNNAISHILKDSNKTLGAYHMYSDLLRTYL